MNRPRIGVTPDIIEDGILKLRPGYGRQIAAAGGMPVVLVPGVIPAGEVLDHLDGILFTGGDDPDMTEFGTVTHDEATPIHPVRQAFELELLAALETRPEMPVLGICLGMQLMALARGGRLDQFLPDSLATAADHWGRRVHTVAGPIGSGEVLSHHRQAIVDPGPLAVVAEAPDGVIEAIADLARPCYVGVQWHPERTEHRDLGAGLFDRLVDAARTSTG